MGVKKYIYQSIPILLPFLCGKLNMLARLVCKDKPRWWPKGSRAPPGPNIFFLVILYFIFVVGPPFSPISLVILNQIATIQPKKLTKTIKIFTMVIVF